MPLNLMHNERVAKALDAALVRVNKEEQQTGAKILNLKDDRYVIFSDQHKGARNGADDFEIAERAYNAALAYYYRMGYTLVVLGDVEELWEERPRAVLQSYDHTLQLEARFHHAGRYLRFWGNHDDNWRYPSQVAAWLDDIYQGERLKVREGIKIRVVKNDEEIGTLFFVHGHQGTLDSDTFSKISRIIVRYIWRPFQRLTNISLNTPAKDWKLRQRHNIALSTWSEGQDNLVLIAGHTHRPVFESLTHEGQIEEDITTTETLLKDYPENKTYTEQLSHLEAELEWVRAQQIQQPHEGSEIAQTKPSYFNTGCCCYRDGDITGIEITAGEIRLVRWPSDDDQPKRKVLAHALMEDVFARC